MKFYLGFFLLRTYFIYKKNFVTNVKSLAKIILEYCTGKNYLICKVVRSG